jgi:hypothetical protein
MDWAAFWPTFLQTHLVTLLPTYVLQNHHYFQAVAVVLLDSGAAHQMSSK